MRAVLTFGVAAAALLAAGAAQAEGPSIEIKDAVARVTVIPQARPDVKVVIQTTNDALPLTIRTEGERTIVDGDLRGAFGRDRIGNCSTVNGVTSVTVRRTKVAWDDIPQVIVYVPMDAEVGAGGAVFGTVGRTRNLRLSNAGCGDWTVGNVAGELILNAAGSGDTHTGSATKALFRLAGSGDVVTGAVAEELSVNIAGSGDVKAGQVGSLSVDIAGSGDADIASVAGPVSVSIAGSGDVFVRRGSASALAVKVAGSGDVRFGGTAGSVNARIAGSGDVQVAAVTGAVSKSVIGSGSVIVGPVTFDD